VLSAIPPSTDDRVLVDFRTADDAGVYRWEGGPALVQTVDFFTPIVDDPYVYGQIAAANSVSDVYAMGGRPLTALAIAGFPKTGLEPDAIAAIFRGGYDKLAEAGVSILGGHTVQDQEIKFGYAVTGAIDERRLLTNRGANIGDVFILTKPIGTGIVGTAIKFERISAEAAAPAIASMRTLNRAAADAASRLPAGVVHACTDITGFGLIGHASEVAAASRVTVAIDTAKVPIFPGVLEIAGANRSGGMASNEEHFGQTVGVDGEIEPDRLALLYDPQTSGGLLFAVAATAAGRLLAELATAGVTAAAIGEAIPARSGVSVALRR